MASASHPESPPMPSASSSFAKDDSNVGIAPIDNELDGLSAAAAPSPHDIDRNTYISLQRVEAVDVSVCKLSITVNRRQNIWQPWKQADKKTPEPPVKILNEVSAEMGAGEIMAIIGSSGSGKTSMLNIMAHRMSGQNLNITGTTTYNGSQDFSSVRNAYVMQQDVLLPRLTVRETLRYSAELRLPAGVSAEERDKVVEEVILQLGLKEVANTPIGDSAHKGCSGGEKRRVSIGVQLLANPSVLFLDEPTTGLDATSAQKLVRTLKNLAKKGRTIVTTLHQPRSEIWGLFDRITLLARGNVIYSGKVSDVGAYFASLGYPFPQLINPADFLIDISAVDYRSPEAEAASVARVESLVAAWKKFEPSIIISGSGTAPLEVSNTADSMVVSTLGEVYGRTAKPSAWRQISVLTRRALVTTYRDPMGAAACIIEATVMSAIPGWIFYNLSGSLSGIRSRQAALFMACNIQGYQLLVFEIYRLCELDMKIFDREHGEGVVGVFAFLTSRRLAKLLTEDIPMPFLFSTIYYFLCGFDADASKFFTLFAIVLVSQFIAMAFAMLAASFSRNLANAALIGNLAYTMQSLASGFFLLTKSIPVYVRWTKWISYNYYAVAALNANEFTDSFYDCPLEAGINNPGCLEYKGNFVLESSGFSKGWILVPIIINIGFAIGFYVVAGLVLKYFTVDINVSSSKKNSDDNDRSAGKEKLSAPENSPAHKIDVFLEDYRLTVNKTGFFGKGKFELDILKGVSTRFESGKLNIIMGPSGSGKSSLLNLMSRRLHNSLTTRYSTSGKMLFNGAEPSDTVVQSLCSYVTQDDDALLPSLTVRETLRFAAALRLPSWMSGAEKERKGEEVIRSMGLGDCADVVIGSEFVKGISGGQKRRVTIAVQILTEPRILLLDEPTSGLDAFTAQSIITVLGKLAEEGRTVICTIHQSRSDLFKKFGNVLLLARGGSTVYSGRADKMLPYFASLGHECPFNTNPADFALDLITVDLQHEDSEKETRIKVNNLITKFSHADALADTTEESKNRIVSLPAELGQMKREKASLFVAFPILLRRSLINIRRQPQLMLARIMQVFGFGMILAIYYAPLKNDYPAVQNRMGYIQQLYGLYFVGMLNNLAIYPNEKDVFYKEHDDGAYSTSAFFLAYTTNEVPFEIITCMLFSLLGDLAVGLPRTARFFFIMSANVLFITNSGESIGIIFNTLFQNSGLSVSIMSTVLSFGVIMSGILSSNMPAVLKGINYISPMKYSAQSLATASLEGVRFTCQDWQRLPDGRCPVETGDDVLRLYALQGNVVWKNMVAMAGVTIAYRLVAYFVLAGARSKWRIGKT